MLFPALRKRNDASDTCVVSVALSDGLALVLPASRHHRHSDHSEHNRKALQLSEIYSRSGHPVIPATRIFEQGTLRSGGGKENIHFKANEEFVSTICKQIESANQLHVLFASLNFGQLARGGPQHFEGNQLSEVENCIDTSQ